MPYDQWLDSADPGLYADEPLGPSNDDSLFAACPREEDCDDTAFDSWHELCHAERAADLLAA